MHLWIKQGPAEKNAKQAEEAAQEAKDVEEQAQKRAEEASSLVSQPTNNCGRAEAPFLFPQGQSPAHQEHFVNKNEQQESFWVAARTSPDDCSGPLSMDPAILKDIN